VLFPRSTGSNEFVDLNEIAPHLSMCGTGNITSLAEMGRMLSSMETIDTYTALQDETQPTRLNEIDFLQGRLSPVSDYSGNSDLTVADFLGTAAGYGHVNRLPRMTELQENLWNDPITRYYKIPWMVFIHFLPTYRFQQLAHTQAAFISA